MKGKIAKGSSEFELLHDLFKFWEEVFIPEDKDSYYEELSHKASSYSEKYRGTDLEELARKIIIDIMNHCDRKITESKRNGKERNGEIFTEVRSSG